MDIKFDKFVNIGQGNFAIKNPLTILIGNNGVGKTLLLEAYAKTNDFFVEKILEKGVIDKIIEKTEFQTQLLKAYTKPYVESRLRNSRKKFEEIQEGSTIIFELKSTIINQDELLTETEKSSEVLLKKIQKVIKEDILFSNEDNDNNILLDNFVPKFSIPVFEILDGREITYEVQLRFIDQKIDSTTNEIDLFDYEDINDSFSLEFGKGGFHGHVSTMKFLTRDENELNKEKFLKNEFEIIHQILKNIISDTLKRMTIDTNNLREISYIPSERIVSVSSFMEKQLLENNYNGLRYSEEKFAKEYINFKEYYSLTSRKIKEDISFDASYKELLGGNPQFDDSGEIIKIVTEDGSIINRSLFSTKQNKIYPFFMVHQNYRNKLYSNFSGNRTLSFGRFQKKTIIIEEPEANLSTKGILEMANYIYELNKKYQIILSTHSDVFLSQINNLYLKNDKIHDVSGYEILDISTPFFIKKLEVSGKFGVSSDFITSQLELLYEITESIQRETSKKEIDRLE